MTKRTQLQKVRDVRRIIDFVKEHGRITTQQVAEMTGLSIKTARLDMQVAQRTGRSSAMVVRAYSAIIVLLLILTW